MAVKMLPASSEADAVARERLRRGAWLPPGSIIPIICRVYEIGDADGRVFIVMKYVEGDTLHAHIVDSNLEPVHEHRHVSALIREPAQQREIHVDGFARLTPPLHREAADEPGEATPRTA